MSTIKLSQGVMAEVVLLRSWLESQLARKISLSDTVTYAVILAREIAKYELVAALLRNSGYDPKHLDAAKQALAKILDQIINPK